MLLLFYVVLPLLPLLLQSAQPNCPALLRLILLFALSLCSSRCWCSFYPCILRKHPLILRIFLRCVRRDVPFTSGCPRSNLASIDPVYFSSTGIPRGKTLHGDAENRKKPVRSCVSRKANFASLWRVLPGRRFGRTRDVRPESSVGTASSPPVSSTTRPVNRRRTFSPNESHVLSIRRPALPPPATQPPPIATPTLPRKLEEQHEDRRGRRVARDRSPGRDAAGATRKFPAKVPAAGSPPGPPPPPSATTAFRHRPPGHPEDEQEAPHDGVSVDPGRAWTESGSAKIVESPSQEERARQAGTDQSKKAKGAPGGREIVLQRVRGEGN